MTLEAWFSSWLANYPGTASASTRERYASFYRNHFADPLGQVQLCELTPDVIDAALRCCRTRAGSPVARSSRRSLTVLLGIALGDAECVDLIPANPVRELILPKQTHRPPFRWTPALVRAQIASAERAGLLNIVRLLIGGALGSLSLRELRWSDVENYTNIRPPGDSRRHGLGRELVLPPFAQEALLRFRDLRPRAPANAHVVTIDGAAGYVTASQLNAVLRWRMRDAPAQGTRPYRDLFRALAEANGLSPHIIRYYLYPTTPLAIPTMEERTAAADLVDRAFRRILHV